MANVYVAFEGEYLIQLYSLKYCILSRARMRNDKISTKIEWYIEYECITN